MVAAPSRCRRTSPMRRYHETFSDRVGPVEDFDAVFNVNVRGTFNALQQAAKRVADGGRVITMSTSVLGMSFPGYATYATSKAASNCSPASWPTNCAGATSASTRSRQAPPRSSCSSTGWRNLRRWSGSARWHLDFLLARE